MGLLLPLAFVLAATAAPVAPSPTQMTFHAFPAATSQSACDHPIRLPLATSYHTSTAGNAKQIYFVAAKSTAARGPFSLPLAPENRGAFQLTPSLENVPESMWNSFPAGVPRPTGPINLLEGDAYAAARQAANQAKRPLSQCFGLVPAGYDVHEITPIKLGGSPTDLANKISLPRTLHRTVTAWFSDLQRLMGGD